MATAGFTPMGNVQFPTYKVGPSPIERALMVLTSTLGAQEERAKEKAKSRQAELLAMGPSLAAQGMLQPTAYDPSKGFSWETRERPVDYQNEIFKQRAEGKLTEADKLDAAVNVYKSMAQWSPPQNLPAFSSLYDQMWSSMGKTGGNELSNADIAKYMREADKTGQIIFRQPDGSIAIGTKKEMDENNGEEVYVGKQKKTFSQGLASGIASVFQPVFGPIGNTAGEIEALLDKERYTNASIPAYLNLPIPPARKARDSKGRTVNYFGPSA